MKPKLTRQDLSSMPYQMPTREFTKSQKNKEKNLKTIFDNDNDNGEIKKHNEYVKSQKKNIQDILEVAKQQKLIDLENEKRLKGIANIFIKRIEL